MTQPETKDDAGFETLQRPELEKVYKWIFELGAAGLVLFYIYSAGFGSASEQYHLGLYLLLTFALIGLLYRFRKRSPRIPTIRTRFSTHRRQHFYNRILDCGVSEPRKSCGQL